MPKNFLILVFMFLMLVSYGQKSTLLQNINFRAKELKHSLNKSGDSLILASEKTIYSVEIFNQDFEKVIDVRGNETKIPLNDTPLGRLVVQAKMPNKRILMTLLRHEEIENIIEKQQKNLLIEDKKPITRTTVKLDASFKINPQAIDSKAELNRKNEKIVEVLIDHRKFGTGATDINVSFKVNPKVIDSKMELNFKNEKIVEVLIEIPITPVVKESVAINETKATSDTNPSRSISGMLNWKPKKESNSDRVFWISYVINSGTNARRLMKMVTHAEADKLISKYKIESSTQQGKLNELTIWEIHETASFLKKQTENPDYINSASSDLFDVIPYFSSTDNTLVAQN